AILGGTGDVGAIAWSPDGKRIATSALDKVPGLKGDYWTLYWAKDNQVLGTPGNSAISTVGGMQSATPITALAWSPDSATLRSVAQDGTLQQWTADGRPLRTPERAIPAP